MLEDNEEDNDAFVLEIIKEFIFNYVILFRRNEEFALSYTVAQYEDSYDKKYSVAMLVVLSLCYRLNLTISMGYHRHLLNKMITVAQDNNVDLNEFLADFEATYSREEQNIRLALREEMRF